MEFVLIGHTIYVNRRMKKGLPIHMVSVASTNFDLIDTLSTDRSLFDERTTRTDDVPNR